ncbi:MAG TPA: decarboxylating 6-phosphogluconate dehydrogenase [Chloroflexota bacterium]|nr:decarboxylating 6-phosphogluconate dehydrogenase [Chloroflexota bacterium]
MELAIVGLGRMGANMAIRLVRGGHTVRAFNRTTSVAVKLAADNPPIIAAASLGEAIRALPTPRIVWLMVPAGQATEDQLDAVLPLLEKGDIVVDGGNSKWRDDAPRAAKCASHGVQFMDCGTSGGVWGLRVGYSLMIGGDRATYQGLEPIWKTLAPEDGYLYCGPNGAGHFVKMVHNGIEYGMLQAYAEGYEILKASAFDLDLHAVAGVWNHGSVVRSWINELAEDAFSKNPNLDGIKGWVADSGEGRWTVEAAIDTDVPAPVLTLSLLERFRSRQDESFAAKVIAIIRNEFGGHEVKTE